MQADPSFEDRVLVTSGSTRVDTDVLVNAALTLQGVAGEAAGVLGLLDSATEVCRTRLGLVPVEAAAALRTIEDARAGVQGLLDGLRALAESLSYAALVYLGAEGRVAAFRDAWMGLGAGGTQFWATGLGSVHSREVLAGMLPEGIRGRVPGTLLDRLAAPAHPFLLGGGLAAWSQLQAAGTASSDSVPSDSAPFDSASAGLASGGDPVPGVRLQMDLRAASALLADHSPAWGPHSASDAGPGRSGVPAPGPGQVGGNRGAPSSTWWGTPEGTTPRAASLAASWGLGLGRVRWPSTRGVQVTRAVPVDTLDMRSGRPIGVRALHTVVGSDPRTRGGGANLTPGSLGLTTAASLVGSALGAIPTPQGGAPTPVPPRAGAARRVDTPRRPSQVLGRITGVGGSAAAGQLEILRHHTPAPGGGSTSWSVVIRGTQQWGVGGANPQDMLSNLQAVAGEDSDQSRAVLAAMEQAGIGAGEPVELVGHSQGGAVAAQLASDPEVAARYRVTSVLTAGSPAGGAQPGPGTAMLNLENTRDLVPGLDGSANRDLGGSRTVHFDGALLGVREDEGGPASAHSLTTYTAALGWLEEGSGTSVAGGGGVGGAGAGGAGGGAAATGGVRLGGLSEVAEWMEQRDRGMGFGEDTETTAFTFDTRRLPSGG